MMKKILAKIKSGISKVIELGEKAIDASYEFLKSKSKFVADLFKKYFKLAKLMLRLSLLGFYEGLKEGYEEWKEEAEESSLIVENEIM